MKNRFKSLVVALVALLSLALTASAIDATDATNSVVTLSGLTNYASSVGLPIMLGITGVLIAIGLVVRFIKRARG